MVNIAETDILKSNLQTERLTRYKLAKKREKMNKENPKGEKVRKKSFRGQ